MQRRENRTCCVEKGRVHRTASTGEKKCQRGGGARVVRAPVPSRLLLFHFLTPRIGNPGSFKCIRSVTILKHGRGAEE